MKVSNMLAKALYDNKAECSDELAFRKGDILMVLEQNIFGSEGWWRCYLHGRQGLAPANRLQLFTITQADSPLTTSSYGSLGRQQRQHNIYQVPSASKTTSMSMYMPMDSIYITPTSLNVEPGEIYQTPVSLPAQILYDKAHSPSNQHMFTLPRASRATSVTQEELYDVPPSKHFSQGSTTTSPVSGTSPVFPSPEQKQQQQIYDIPSSQDTPGKGSMRDPKVSNVYDVPPTGKLHLKDDQDSSTLSTAHFNTLPNPRKSEWIYDIPVSPDKKHLKSSCRKISVDQQLIYDVPPIRYGSSVVQESSQIYDVPPLQRNVSVADQSLYDVPSSNETSPLQQNGSLKKCFTRALRQKAERNDSKDNVYDIPRGLAAVTMPNSETSSPVGDQRVYDVPPPLPRNCKPSLNSSEDRLSVSSSESRTSTLSTASTTSGDSFTMSSPDDTIKDVMLDLDSAVKRLTQLQERVSSSIASLMIFVSSKWRLQENMESNIEEIHSAVDSIVSSLGSFTDFSQSIKTNICNLTDNNIQQRINKQLQTLTDSSVTLSRNREAINRCNWSLQALVINKPLSTPDDLDRFVMVARTIPDDIKRFVSIIIANGKLLFKSQEELKISKIPKEQKIERKLQMPVLSETKVFQESACVNKIGEKRKEKKHPFSRKKVIDDSDYVHLQKKEEFERLQKLSLKQLENKTQNENKRKGWLKTDSRVFESIEQEKKTHISSGKKPAPLPKQHTVPLPKQDTVPLPKQDTVPLPKQDTAPLPKQDTAPLPKQDTMPSPKQDTMPSPEQETFQEVQPAKKILLSEHSHLYFGGIQKAIGVLNNSLDTNQPPEVFIAHGKLIIMVGQKLVDYICQDVKGNDARNDILHKSSELCSLLKDLAVATKTAAIKYPSPTAVQELQKKTSELCNHIQLFKAMVE